MKKQTLVSLYISYTHFKHGHLGWFIPEILMLS